jgi:hypothetical protein
MKKNVVLFALFVLPIVAYLFFASGVNSFTKLPTLRTKVAELPDWDSAGKPAVKLTEKITVIGFPGGQLLRNRGNFFNLNEKIYRRYFEFKDLQFVYVCPIETKAEVEAIFKALAPTTNLSGYKFVFATKEEIQAYFKSYGITEQLDSYAGTDKVFLIDKERNLRGRKDDDEYKEGYSTFHPSELSNEMLDDFKILIYEYRAALKKNLPKREI